MQKADLWILQVFDIWILKSLGMPLPFEIKNYLVSHMSEVADMMLAEDQEINALELVGNAREKKGVEKGIICTLKILRGMGVDDAIIIDRISKEFDISREYVRELMKKV